MALHPYIAACCGLGGCCNTGSHVPQGFLAYCLCFMLGGTKMWLLNWVSHFSIDHVVWLALCVVFISGPPVLSDTGE